MDRREFSVGAAREHVGPQTLREARQGSCREGISFAVPQGSGRIQQSGSAPILPSHHLCGIAGSRAERRRPSQSRPPARSALEVRRSCRSRWPRTSPRPPRARRPRPRRRGRGRSPRRRPVRRHPQCHWCPLWSARLAGHERVAVHLVGPRLVFPSSPAEGVGGGSDFNVDKPGVFHHLLPPGTG